jgi:hypothetical protein
MRLHMGVAKALLCNSKIPFLRLITGACVVLPQAVP